MPINEALFAAMKAASYIKPNAGKSYKLQRVAEELIAKQAPDNPKCRVEDAFAPMADGYAVPLRVFTPLVAYGAPLPEDKQKPHHDMILVDTERSYKEVLKGKKPSELL